MPRVRWPSSTFQGLGLSACCLSSLISCFCLFPLLCSINTDALASPQTGDKHAPCSGLCAGSSLGLDFSFPEDIHNTCPQLIYIFTPKSPITGTSFAQPIIDFTFRWHACFPLFILMKKYCLILMRIDSVPHLYFILAALILNSSSIIMEVSWMQICYVYRYIPETKTASGE